MQMKPLEEIIEERFVRATGPGGQNVNKVSSAVQLRYPIAQDPRLKPAQAQRLRQLAGRKLAAGDVIVLDAKEYRSQEQNRVAARARLEALLIEALRVPKRRRPTRPTRGSKERRLAAKSNRSIIKQRRGRPKFED